MKPLRRAFPARMESQIPTWLSEGALVGVKQKCAALIKAGKPAKVALVALMRKLIILVNTLIREDREWGKIGLD